MRRYSAPTAMTSLLPSFTNSPISCPASPKTRALTATQNTATACTDRFMPCRMRSSFLAPWFWATKVEKALPKSCTGEYARVSTFTATANADITVVPKLFTSPCTMRIPRFMMDCWMQVSAEK